VTIDAETNSLSMDVSEEEIAVRLSEWKAPRMKVNRGALAKYAFLVGDASHGVRCSRTSTLLYMLPPCRFCTIHFIHLAGPSGEGNVLLFSPI